MFSQSIIWKDNFDGITGNNQPFKSVIDDDDNVYIVCWFLGSIDIGTNSYTVGSSVYNSYVAKFDGDGNFIWSKNIGGITTHDLATGIDISNDNNNLYVLVDIFDSLIIEDVFYEKTDGSFDAFIIDFDANTGNVNNTQKVITNGLAGSSTLQRSNDIKVDINGDILITGYTISDQLSIIDTTIDIENPVTCILSKFDSDLSREKNWPRHYRAINNYNRFFTIETTNDAYYICGYYNDSMYFDIDTLTNNSTVGIFLYKMNSNGDGEWIRKIKGNTNDYSVSCGYDGDRSVYISGYTASSYLRVDSAAGINDTSVISYTPQGGNDVIFARYDTSGILQWYNRFGSSGDDRLTRVYANSEYVLIAGQYGGDIDFGAQQVTNRGGLDALGLIFDNNNNLVHILNAGGTGSDIGRTGLIDSEGNYIFVGDFQSPKLYIVNDSSLTNATTSTKDMFIVKFDKMILSGIETDPSCNGVADGRINLIITGSGSPPFSYAWSNGASTEDIDDLIDGEYTVTVTDAMSHSVERTFNLSDPPLLTSSGAVLTNVDCKFNFTGSAQIDASGGTGTLNYNINGGGYQSSNVFSNLAAGNYSMVAKDSNSCTDTSSVIITEPAQALTGVVSSIPISAPGNTDGEATMTPSGGTIPYEYQLDAGVFQSDSTFTSLGGGQYTLTVRDDSNCTYSENTTICTFTLSMTKTDITCNGLTDGTATVSVNGGVGPFAYLWTNSETTTTASSLGAGTHTVRVIDTSVPDTAYADISISEPTALSSSASPTHVSCAGGNNGSIYLSVNGGTAPYSYAWTRNGSEYPDSVKDISYLIAGSYQVTVTDTNNCTSNANATVNELSLISVGLTPTHQTCYGGTNNGSLSTSVSGAYGGVIYFWSNGRTTSSISSLAPDLYSVTVTDAAGCDATGSQVINAGPQIGGSISKTDVVCFEESTGEATMNPTFESGRTLGSYLWDNPAHSTTATINGLDSGVYKVIVKDNLNCEQSFSTTITQPTALGLTENLPSHVNVLCKGDATGVIEVTPSGGSGQYDYQLNSGTWVTSSIFSGLTAGNYQVNVRDQNATSCTYTGLSPVTITEPSVVLDITAIIDSNVNCFGGNNGKITASGTGGTPSYEYSIDNGANYQSSGVFTGLIAINYRITIRDASGCTDTSTYESITEPTALDVTTVDSSISCNGAGDGIITASGSGGTPAYEYSIDNGANYQSSGIFTGLGAATDYRVTVRDANGCTDTSTIETITEPPILDVTIVVDTNVSCNGGSDGQITASGTGGTTTYEYSIDDGTTYQPSNIFTGLTASVYSVTIRDANNCTDTSNIVTILSPNSIYIDTTIVSDITCYGFDDGSIMLLAAGGVGDFQYSIDQESSYQTNGYFNNLSDNSYRIIFKDSNNCVDSSDLITIIQPDSISVTNDSTIDVACNGEANGEIYIEGAGGRGPLSYSINGGIDFYSIGEFKDLSTGRYTIVIKDTNECSAETDIYEINEPDELEIIDTNYSNISCNGENNGFIDISISGGIGDYEYSIDGGINYQGINAFSNLNAGTYNITVRDENNCQILSESITIINPDPISVNEDASMGQSQPLDAGDIIIVATGGTGTLSYSIDGGITDLENDGYFYGLSLKEDYYLIIKDKNECIYFNDEIVKALANYVGIEDHNFLPIIVPTVLTLNGNGINDTWKIQNLNAYEEVKIELYTLYGKLVFSSDDKFFEWDGFINGNKTAQGIYIYKVTLNDELITTGKLNIYY
ncbi:T9SS type B sorting domain-containing protein [Bacteroidota bacterium]